MKPVIQRLYFRHNQFFFLHKQWQNHPIEYYHAHEGIEFLYIHEGSGRLILDDRLYVLQPRTLVFFQPFQLHLLRYEHPYLRSIVKIKPPQLESFTQMFPYLSDFTSYVEKSKMEQQIFRLNAKQDAELSAQLAQFDETLQTFPGHEHKEQFLVFLMQFMSYFKSRIVNEFGTVAKDVSPRKAHHVEKIENWVKLHFKESFDLNKLASDIHLSASYLSGLFRQYTGMTITEYITIRRLDQACLLLQTTDLSINQVGRNSGFPNVAYFCRSFKKRYALTPQQFRIKSTQPFGTVASPRIELNEQRM